MLRNKVQRARTSTFHGHHAMCVYLRVGNQNLLNQFSPSGQESKLGVAMQ